MNRNHASRILSGEFPDSTITILCIRSSFHSTIIHFTASGINGENETNLVAKASRTKSTAEITQEYQEQREFFLATKCDMVSAPEPISVDLVNRVIVMRYVQGKTLRNMLMNLHPDNRSGVTNAMKLSAHALASFHAMSTCRGKERVSFTSPYLEPVLNTDEIDSVTRNLSISHLVKPFLDFSVNNILICESGDRPTACLVDFPHIAVLSAPHIDFARFRLSLRVLKEYPRFRMTGISRWEVNDLFSIFLEEYQSIIGIPCGKEDRQLINWLEREYTRHLGREYFRLRSNPKILLESIYMRRLFSALEGKDWRLT